MTARVKMEEQRKQDTGPPLVSIIIPCYNAEAHVGGAIKSALAQTYTNKEVIVIDDGSTDRSLERIRSFGGSIRWETGPNRGGNAARNRGIALARGTYLQFLDADDLLLPEKLSRQLEEDSGEEIILCRGVKEDGSRQERIGQPKEQDFFRMACLDILTITGPLMRKETVEKAGAFREDLCCCQERDLHVRLALRQPSWRFVDASLFCIRTQPASVSSNLERVADTYRDVYYSLYRDLKSRDALGPDRAQALAEAMIQGARLYVQAGAFAKAEEYARLAREMHPSAGLANLPIKQRLAATFLGPVRTERLRKYFSRKKQSQAASPSSQVKMETK